MDTIRFVSVCVQVLLVKCADAEFLRRLMEKKSSANCLAVNSNSDCMCCISGYRGEKCQETCPRCKSRLFQAICLQFCEAGYWGPTCNMTCPEKCAIGGSGQKHCTQDLITGLPACFHGCKTGFYGWSCDQTCSKGCSGQLCDQNSGLCLKCDGDLHGDYCDTTCKDGDCKGEVKLREGAEQSNIEMSTESTGWDYELFLRRFTSETMMVIEIAGILLIGVMCIACSKSKSRCKCKIEISKR